MTDKRKPVGLGFVAGIGVLILGGAACIAASASSAALKGHLNWNLVAWTFGERAALSIGAILVFLGLSFANSLRKRLKPEAS